MREVLESGGHEGFLERGEIEKIQENILEDKTDISKDLSSVKE